jgi:hypothetical protein
VVTTRRLLINPITNPNPRLSHPNIILVLTPADVLYCGLFIHPILWWCYFPEIGTSSMNWAQLKSLLPEHKDRIHSLIRCVLNKTQMADNVQKLKNCKISMSDFQHTVYYVYFDGYVHLNTSLDICT